MASNPFRQLPSVHALLEHPCLQAQTTQHPRPVQVVAIRAELAELRQQIRSGQELDGPLDGDTVAQRVLDRLRQSEVLRFQRVINATGIILHTNLGRSLLAEPAVRAVETAARGYVNLELDLTSGKRSSRQAPIRRLLTELTGAEAATVVNNCAAATVLTLRALAAGREVIVSRGQLVEIGGSFRIPDIMATSGAILREVGTTNITRLSDYAQAITPHTAALMLIHPSNYRQRGFVKSVHLRDLIALGRQRQIPIIDDCGSGAFLNVGRFGLAEEPVIPERIATGADVLLCSGDKLLGGPQAGLILGRKSLIQAIERDPLMRAFRGDKLTLAALEATLRLYRDEKTALSQIPTLCLLQASEGDLRQRAEQLAESLRKMPGVAEARVRRSQNYVGGGSVPDRPLPGWGVVLQVKELSETTLAERLRLSTPAVMARVRRGRVCLEMRTILHEQETPLLQAVQAILTVSDNENC